MNDELEAIKAGARHNANDMKGVQSMHDLACALGATCEKEQPEEAVKATGLDMSLTEYNTPPLAIKIAGDMELDVCYMPYSGQRNGKDSDGQYFSPRTNEHAAKFPTPLVLYYHGYEKPGVQQSVPEEIGLSTGKKWADKAGRWMRVKLDDVNAKARLVWDSAQKGKARASSDSVSHLVRVAADGEITNWPFIGISLFETESGKAPANSFAFALPAAKALGFTEDEKPEDNSGEIKAIVTAIVSAVLES